MERVTIKFWSENRKLYVGNDHDYAVDSSGNVIHVDWPWMDVDLEPHFYINGERVA